ncbi:tyrosyl-tRNA synthetase [Pilibacter termitis]|uniref:Tyrosine--tRNA ligase n=1 Tax=Pilibacter termitis TaxID=263852 RepID=A0A1T4P4J5_9ENTE|nr:tyrosine--tRNA ligase [Pilibacter termitis]SJZ86433.1 tyrosyl-tRNA synthetase [Pilibacter termitis]
MSLTFFEELKERGLIFQSTDEKEIEKKLNEGSSKIYIGFDPTADSLHLGHLVPVLMLKRFQEAGHTPVALVGGATGMIGDPSFKDSERQLNTVEVVQNWSEAIKGQLSQFVDFEGVENAAIIVNNYDWLGNISLIDFLRDVGKHFTINYMMSKESVKRRIETGISYTEFAYQILQGYDFYKLFNDYGVEFQAGGSDQWGNITAGTELIRRMTGKTGYAFTLPLITNSDGKKFGKSEGNAVWLDPDKTSPYEFYQFWLNVADDDVIPFMKYFTFLSLDRIAEIEGEFNEDRGSRLGQKILAEEMTKIVHGEKALEDAKHISEVLFKGGNLKSLPASVLEKHFENVPSYTAQTDENFNIVELLVASQISPSKRQAREDVTNGAIYINGERVQDLSYTLGETDKIDEKFTIIRRGKKKNFIIRY